MLRPAKHRSTAYEVVLGSTFRVLGPWLLYHVAWMLEDGAVTYVLTEFGDFASRDAAPSIQYVHACCCICALVVTVVVIGVKRWLIVSWYVTGVT